MNKPSNDVQLMMSFTKGNETLFIMHAVLSMLFSCCQKSHEARHRRMQHHTDTLPSKQPVTSQGRSTQDLLMSGKSS